MANPARSDLVRNGASQPARADAPASLSRLEHASSCVRTAHSQQRCRPECIRDLARRLYAVGYGHADRVICQTQSMADELRRELGIDSARLVVLPNPVDIQGIRAAARANNNFRQSPGHRLLAVARLAPEKGIDLLLEAFARVRSKFPEVELEIAGSGSCEVALKEQCKMLGIDGQVEFLGNVNSPAEHFRSASVFVLSSRHEGLPNALLEAAAAGLPIVALPASPGLVDLLSGQPGVWLASEISADGLEQALCRCSLLDPSGAAFPTTHGSSHLI